jgi:hypothetical protein
LNIPPPTRYASDHVFHLEELACKLLHSDQAEASFGVSDPPRMNKSP